MANTQAHTMREIDLTLARALRKARTVARAVQQKQVAVRAHPRTRTPGPNTYKRMSAGQLAAAFLAGEAVYRWSQQEQGFFRDELHNRGFDESLETWQDEQYEPSHRDEGIDTPRFDHSVASLAVLTTAGLDNLANAIDEVILGGDGRVPGALPPAEVIEDMQITNADPDAIVAYETGVGTSPISPADLLDEQAPQMETADLAVEDVAEQQDAPAL